MAVRKYVTHIEMDVCMTSVTEVIKKMDGDKNFTLIADLMDISLIKSPLDDWASLRGASIFYEPYESLDAWVVYSENYVHINSGA